MPPYTNHHIYHEEPAPAGGLLSIIESGNWYRVGWREDRRRKYLSVEMWDHKFDTVEEGIAIFPTLKEKFTLPEGTMINEHGDFQKTRLYSWEHTLPQFKNEIPLTLEQHKEFTNRLFNSFAIPHPEMFYNDSKPKRRNFWRASATIATCDRWTIQIKTHYSGSMTVSTLLHEYAHWIMRHCYTAPNSWKTTYSSHGPEFTGVLMRLFNKFANVPMLDMVTHAKLKRVKYCVKLNDSTEKLFSQSAAGIPSEVYLSKG